VKWWVGEWARGRLGDWAKGRGSEEKNG